jgi:hypothetical protein
MYENLEYQRMRVISMIETDPLLLRQYREYLGYINANYFWHEAMYSLSRGDRRSAWELFVRALADGRGMFLSRRSLGFLKKFLTDSVGTDQITDQN